MRVRIFLTFMILGLFVSGCMWLNILDTNPEPSQNSYKFSAVKRSEAYKLLGSTMDEVMSSWGRPEFIEKNASFCKDNGEDCKCVQGKCGDGVVFVNERWRYTVKERLGFSEVIYYSVDFYYKDGVLVKIK